jgi:hypothetical protein
LETDRITTSSQHEDAANAYAWVQRFKLPLQRFVRNHGGMTSAGACHVALLSCKKGDLYCAGYPNAVVTVAQLGHGIYAVESGEIELTDNLKCQAWP